ncbi:MAG: PHA/PHB synthase family protein [Candidatus Berkiella sp.]
MKDISCEFTVQPGNPESLHYQKRGGELNPLDLFNCAMQQSQQSLQAWWQLFENVQNKVNRPKATFETDLEDKRFSDPKWGLPLFYFYHQAYLLYTKQILDFLEHNPSSDPKITQQINFFTKQYLDAVAPSNFPLTNPEVLEQTIEKQGENFRQGLQNWLEDVAKHKGQIQMTDLQAFELGKNIAVSKGKVVYQNSLIQLIQYEATTEKVFKRPLLMIPPWINKYYILDLTEKKSLVKWLVNEGFTVFMISWVNPDKSYQDTQFENYVTEGVLAAIDAIKQATGEDKVNALGFCIGGTLLAVTTAYLKAINDPSINSATFLTSLIDFSEPGDLGVFIDENQVERIEKEMESVGYLDGRVMMNTFNMLRANDLQWSYYVNNYLCGNKPFAFDLLYWNSDPANLPAKMQSFYLRNFYLENRLCVPNCLQILGKPLDLQKVNIPCYFLSTLQDHIAPWPSTFMGAKCLGGPTTFVLAGSGHIAGVVNPPTNQKYGYQHCDMELRSFSDPKAWLKQATSEKGSWWPHWTKWLMRYAGDKVNKRVPGDGKLKVLQDAPGSYVRKRVE